MIKLKDEIKQPLSNVQLEILKAFSHHLPDEELKDFKEILAESFANIAIQSADKAWDERGGTGKDVDRLLNTKMRKSKS